MLRGVSKVCFRKEANFNDTDGNFTFQQVKVVSDEQIDMREGVMMA